jgi:hypothetical protein
MMARQFEDLASNNRITLMDYDLHRMVVMAFQARKRPVSRAQLHTWLATTVPRHQHTDFEPAPAQVPWQIGILFAFKPHRADIWTRHHGASAFPDGLV